MDLHTARIAQPAWLRVITFGAALCFLIAGALLLASLTQSRAAGLEPRIAALPASSR